MEIEKGKEQPMIKVVVRKRPLNKKEIARAEQDVVDTPSHQEVVVREQKTKVDLTKFVDEHCFKFDQVMDHNASNHQIYHDCIRPLVQYAFQGAKVTCFAYGQTGSGKTYTMNGDPENGVLGMYYLGAEDIFSLRNQFYSSLEVYLSFYEIYCSKLFDLLNNREQLQAREDAKQNVNIIGLTVKHVSSPSDLMTAIAKGSALRITSQNSSNADSSRSHAILQIELKSGKKSHGKMAFIDLAGCERGADTLEQNKQTKIDGAEINKSLLALKQCIRALDQGKNHTPFRGSKLTMVLKDSFSGFCKTVMIANIAPSSSSCENTLNTLRYADRVKTLKKGTEGQKEREVPPRSYFSRPGNNNNEPEEEQKAPFLQQIQKMMNNHNQAVSGKNKKITKYIIKDENERVKADHTPARKAIISTENCHQQPLKASNHFPKKRDYSRNKSVVPKEKISHKNMPVIGLEREIFSKNPSIVFNRKELVPSPGPESQWDKAVLRFQKWTPTSYSFGEMSQLFEQMVRLVMKQQVQLCELHRGLLMQEESSHKQLALLYHETQNESKNNSEMMEWADRLAQLMEKKSQALNSFKDRSNTYKQHLKEHQFCQNRLVTAAEILADGLNFGPQY